MTRQTHDCDYPGAENSRFGKDLDLESLAGRLWPLLRSITGQGVRDTLGILGEYIPLEIFEIPTGAACFDWSIPKEWVVGDAYLAISGPSGRRVADVKANNLHLVNYSAPFIGRISKAELEKHLHSIPEMPGAIPYVTSYYEEDWGFCLAHQEREQLPDCEYYVHIDTKLIDGHLTLAHCLLAGESEREIMVEANICHPSLGNNELGGMIAALLACRRLARLPQRRYTYRFVFAPETIGALAYLKLHLDHLQEHMAAGFTLQCLATGHPFTYKRSRRGGGLADRAAELYLASSGSPHNVLDFFPWGADERQFCSPGVDLPVGCLMRLTYDQYPEYHTSLDNLDFISLKALAQSADTLFGILMNLEMNRAYQSTAPMGEPNLGKRGLYPAKNRKGVDYSGIKAMKWVLNYSDGRHDLMDIAKMSGVPLADLHQIAEELCGHGLLRPCG